VKELPALGIVVIGRNEGERLRRCLASVTSESTPLVYVDSGSTDGSIALARSMGADVAELDLAIPFTAARARNAGFQRLRALHPTIEFVQFVDGDCELVPGWLEAAVRFLQDRPDVAAVCGRRRERYSERTIYNRLCDLEWDTPVGEAKACGGDALMLAEAFAAVGGFRPDLIAGEEPELCVRFRQAGWKIWRLDAEMALHDAAMTRFGQWWRRAVRGGYAFAQGAHLHGRLPERHWVRESRRALAWGVALPTATLSLSLMDARWLFLLVLYPMQVVRLAFSGRRSARDNWLQAFFWVLGRFPEGLGQLKFLGDRLLNRKHALIEYK
jgi:GT2 family glycosyltransferase